MPKLLKIKQFAISLQYLKKEVNDELIIYIQAGMKTHYKLMLWFCWGWLSISKVPKIASLQGVYNISKKKLDMKLIFCMLINIKWPTSWFQHFGHQIFLQVNTIIIDGHDEAFS